MSQHVVDNRLFFRVKKSILFSLVVLLPLIALPVFANDADFEGNGAVVYPVKQSQVAMVSERVELIADEIPTWQVVVEHVFENRGGATRLQLGFPLQINPFDGAGDESYPDFRFRTWADGREIPVRRGTGIANPALPGFDFSVVYLSEISFSAGQRRRVRHTYIVGGLRGLDDWQINYILRTGALWREPIGRAEIVVRMPVNLATTVHCASPAVQVAERTGREIRLRWLFRDLLPDFDIVISGQIERTIEQAYKWSEQKTLENWVNAAAERFGWNKEGLSTKLNRDCKLTYLSNLIRAYHGAPLNDPLAKAQFYGGAKPKFKRRSRFRLSDIPPDHRQLLDRLDAGEDVFP